MNIHRRALIILIGVFLLGCLTGAAGWHFWAQKDPFRSESLLGSARGNPLQRLENLLQLTPSQQSKLKEIFEGLRRRMDAFQQETEKQRQALRQQINLQIMEILTPEQKEKFNRYIKDAEERRGDFHHRGASKDPTVHH